MRDVSVYLDGYSFDLRPRNSDWSYVESKMPRVTEWAPTIRFTRQKSRVVLVRANYKAVRAAIRRRIGVSVNQRAAAVDRLDARELSRSGCGVVFSHREYPANSGDVPVVWMNAVVDPEMTMQYLRIGTEVIAEEIAAKYEFFKRAAFVQVCTDAEAKRHATTYPEIADRFVAVPLFGPHITLASESIMQKHRRALPLRFIFVGNGAKRKGLQETIDAYAAIPSMIRRHASLTIVSHFDRASITIPDGVGIKVHRGLPQSDVLALIRDSHVLINVAHHESFGMVFLEAMSQGTLCIGPDWEVQRELLDNGLAGMNVRCNVDLIRDVMVRAIEDEDHRIAFAYAGWRRFKERYAPSVVAQKYADLFRAAAIRKG